MNLDVTPQRRGYINLVMLSNAPAFESPASESLATSRLFLNHKCSTRLTFGQGVFSLDD